MADFTLVVDVDYGASLKNMRESIEGIVKDLNANPPKIKVQFDDASLKSMQDQITKLTNSVQKSSGGKTSGTSKAIKDIGDQAEKSADSVKKLSRSVDDAGKTAKEAEARQKAAAAALKAYNSAIVQGEQRMRDWSAAENSKNQSSREAYQRLRESIEAMRQASAADLTQEKNIEALRAATENYKNTLKETEQVVRANGDATQSLGQKLGGLAAKFSAWLSVSQVIMYAIRGIKQMVSASVELETALSQLQIVTGASEGELREFKDTAVDLAKDLGQSVSDVMKSIEVFSRLGYSLPDATELSKYATILANVASVSMDEATTGLTSIIKGYNLKVEDAQHVADVLVEVGQKYAVSAGEMMEAYERSGAALNATNTSFEKSAGLIAAANAAVQDASTVGTALKTISARIQSSKSDLEELGESTDDLAEGFSKYAAEIKALTGVNIMVEGTTDTFKDLYDIMSEIAGVWDQLTDTQQARVSEILGGTRQRQIISSIIGNWKDAVGAYETAMNSAGAATRANDIYMQTAAAHIKQFKAAFQELSSNLISAGFVTSVVDFGRHILEILNIVAKLIDALGGLGTVLKVTAGVLAIINAQAIFNTLNKIPAAITSIISPLSEFGNIFRTTIDMARLDGVSSFRAFSLAATSSFDAFITSAAGAMTVIVGLVAAVSALKSHIDKVTSGRREDASSYLKAAQSESSDIYSLYEAYETAKSSIDDSAASKDALRIASENLAAALGVEKSAIDGLNDGYTELTKSQLDASKIEAERSLKLISANMFKTTREAEGLEPWVMEALGGSLKTYNETKDDIEKMRLLVQGYDKLQEEINSLIDNDKAEGMRYNALTRTRDFVKDDVEAARAALALIDSLNTQIGKIDEGTVGAVDDAATEAAEAAKTLITAEKTVSEITKDALSGIWSSEGFASAKNELVELANTIDGISPKNIEDLAASSEELAAILEMDGMSAEFLALVLEREIRGGDGFDLITESALRLNEALNEVQNGLKGATAELQKYQEAASSEKGDVAEQYGNAYKKFVEDWNSGRTGTNAVQAAIELFIPDSVLQSLDYDLQAAGELLSSELYQRIFDDSGDYGANFANYIRETFGNALDGIVEIRENGDSFDFLISSYSDLASALGMDENLVIALMDALDAYGVQAMVSGEETAKLAAELGLVGSNASNLSKIQSAIDGLANVGKTEVQIRQILDLLASAGYIDLSGVENLGEKISEAVSAAHEVDEVQAQPEITVDVSGALKAVSSVKDAIASVKGKSVDIVVNHHDNYYSNDYTGGNSGGSGNQSSNKIGAGKASGGTSKNGGKTLVNEVKPELISENGEAYIANGGKPAIVDLAPGAIVLDGDTTEEVLKGTGKKTYRMRSAVGGFFDTSKAAKKFGNTQTTTTTTTTTTTSTTTTSKVPVKAYGAPIPTNSSSKSSVKANTGNLPGKVKLNTSNVATIPYSSYNNGSGYGDGYGDGGYGGYDDYVGNGDTSSSSKQDSWFDHLYEQHNHMLKMDQESQQQYLDWLDGAYKDAFNQGLLELKDFHKYEEEVYKGRQDLFKDHISDLDHAIGLEQNGENRPTVIVNMYQQLLGDIQNQIDIAHQKGLDDNNEYIQYLQNQWNKYYKDLKALREDSSDDAKEQVDDLVQYRIKMLKQYLKNEINSLKERLNYLKDFYNHQKEMLQDVYDTENYLDEQSEKRKNVSDIENEMKALEFDDSAWAQKRRLQLQQELDEAQKDLDDFERQHALSVAQDELDAMYSIQEAAINAKMDQLNEKLDDPKALYEQALLDVQNNTIALYEEMIEFNNKYGSGIKQDIVDMWENAYISLRKYAELYGTLYNGISLVNATDYEWPSASTGSGYASGTRNATHGFHRLDEIGAEYVFTSANGNKYRLLNGGDKVLDSRATDFLYNFANTGGKIIPNMIASSVGGVGGFGGKSSVIGDIRLGDIIIQGNADERTVSEIRRAQRESVDFLLKEFNRLKK